jgi:nicotinamide phosphoribosyltransferase
MTDFLSLYNTDVYKTGHKLMLPKGSNLMYSYFCPRSSKHSNARDVAGVVSFGQQMMIRMIEEDWRKNFFERDIKEIDQFGKDLTEMLNLSKPFDVSHFKSLHKLGYLPITVKAMEEGIVIPYGTPFYTVVNSEPISQDIADWVVNYLETQMSCESWLAPTSATSGLAFRKLGKKWLEKTDKDNMWFLDYMFHDFSFRGHTSKEAATKSALGFATCTRGSDTLTVIPAARKYYGETEVPINSVIASEHAIMCSLTGFFLQQKDGSWDKIGELEVETFRYLLEKFPTGILSLVSDTWDLWQVLTEYCVELKDLILNRDGKLVIRPDSGNPVDIICGHPINELLQEGDRYYIKGKYTSHRDQFGAEVWGSYKKGKEITLEELRGVIESLWNIFGGTVNEQGHKVLNPKVGCIYGDSINIERATAIFERLADKKFAASNIVLAPGSYTFQYVTRDTHGFAQKASYIEVDNTGIEIFKDPKTSSSTLKTSHKGLLRVEEVDGKLVTYDQQTKEQESEGLLQVIFKNGKFFNQTTFTEIRKRIDDQL